MVANGTADAGHAVDGRRISGVACRGPGFSPATTCGACSKPRTIHFANGRLRNLQRRRESPMTANDSSSGDSVHDEVSASSPRRMARRRAARSRSGPKFVPCRIGMAVDEYRWQSFVNRTSPEDAVQRLPANRRTLLVSDRRFLVQRSSPTGILARFGVCLAHLVTAAPSWTVSARSLSESCRHGLSRRRCNSATFRCKNESFLVRARAQVVRAEAGPRQATPLIRRPSQRDPHPQSHGNHLLAGSKDIPDSSKRVNQWTTKPRSTLFLSRLICTSTTLVIAVQNQSPRCAPEPSSG